MTIELNIQELLKIDRATALKVSKTDEKISWVWEMRRDSSCEPFGDLSTRRLTPLWNKIEVTYLTSHPHELQVRGIYSEITRIPKIGREQNGMLRVERTKEMKGIWTQIDQTWVITIVSDLPSETVVSAAF